MAETPVKNKNTAKRDRFADLFLLFIFGSLLGVVIEGIFCLLTYGRWETHVVSVWGHFCIIYGIGCVGFYIGGKKLAKKRLLTRFLIFALSASAIELLCGLLLEKGLGMYAWDYKGQFLNFRGLISLKMGCAWGVLGLVFSLAIPSIDRGFDRLHPHYKTAVLIIAVSVIAFDLLFTGVCIGRWSARHNGRPADSRFEAMLDSRYDDEFMQNRFCEWHFISDQP